MQYDKAAVPCRNEENYPMKYSAKNHYVLSELTNENVINHEEEDHSISYLDQFRL